MYVEHFLDPMGPKATAIRWVISGTFFLLHLPWIHLSARVGNRGFAFTVWLLSTVIFFSLAPHGKDAYDPWDTALFGKGWSTEALGLRILLVCYALGLLGWAVTDLLTLNI